MRDRQFEVAFDMHARKGDIAIESIGDAERPQELDFSGFEVPEHGGVVNAPARVGVDEANAGLEAKRLGLGHLDSMAQFVSTKKPSTRPAADGAYLSIDLFGKTGGKRSDPF